MSPAFEPANPDYEQRARETFARQGLMATFAAELRSIEPGAVEIEVPFSPELSQQDEFFHAGVGIAILDTACGCAAFTLMPAGTDDLATRAQEVTDRGGEQVDLQLHG